MFHMDGSKQLIMTRAKDVEFVRAFVGARFNQTNWLTFSNEERQ